MSITVRQGRTRRWTGTIRDASGNALVNTYTGSETLTLSLWPVGTTNAVTLSSSSNAAWLNATAGTFTATLFQTDTTNSVGTFEAVVTVTTGGEIYDALPTLVVITPSRSDTTWLVQPLEVAASWPAFGDLDPAEQTSLIEAATDAIEQACGRSFALQTYTETYDGDNMPRLWLRNRPAGTISSVTANNSAIASGDYTVDARLGCLWWGSPGWAGTGRQRQPGWPAGVQNVTVTYTAGFATTPASVKRAAILTCRYLYDAAKSSGAYQSESLGDYSYTLAAPDATLPPAVVALIAPYAVNEPV